MTDEDVKSDSLNASKAPETLKVPTTYTVLSDNFAIARSGETVTEDELDGCNITALIEGGHLARVNKADSAEKKE